jgi:hypothetical protein
MNAQIFAEWLRRRGYRVVRTQSSYWYEVSPRVYQAFPYHWVIEPREKELKRLLRQNNAIALRYSTPVAAPRGKLSYHVVSEGAYELESLPRRARQNVRRGLRYATVERIPMSRLATEGWGLRLDTLERQGRAEAENEAWWRRVCETAQDLPGFEAWGAIRNGELVASFLAFTCDSCFMLPYEQSATSYLKLRVNNAIFFAVTHEALQRDGVSQVFFCLQSLDAPASVDDFKFRMGLTAKPVRQRVVFHPWLAPLFSRASQAVLQRLVCRYPDSPTWAKAEGMVRFYLEGKRAPDKQDWPECLADRRSELLEASDRSGELLGVEM